MDLYGLTTSLTNDFLIEGYESAIWTERFHESGEIEISFPLTKTFTDNLPIGTYIGSSLSDRVMRVDTREFSRDEDGRRFLKVSGESLEAILKYRVAWTDRFASSINNQFVMQGSIKKIVEAMIRRAGFSGNLDDPPFDGSIDLNHLDWHSPKAMFDRAGYPVCTLPDPGDGAIVKDRPMSTYDYILEICRAYNIGYRMIRQPGHNPTFAILVHVYQGRDLTRGQTEDAPVIFSTKHDNLENESMIETIRDHYRGVWVWDTDENNPQRTGVFLPDYTGNPEANGLDMRTGFIVTSPPEDATVSERAAYRQQLGVEFLHDHGAKEIVDGEISQNSQYKYGVDYRLGDRVEVETQFNYSANMRVTEQIFISDSEGVKSYPTLSAEVTVNQDSWMAQPTTRQWINAAGNWVNE